MNVKDLKEDFPSSEDNYNPTILNLNPPRPPDPVSDPPYLNPQSKDQPSNRKDRPSVWKDQPSDWKDQPSDWKDKPSDWKDQPSESKDQPSDEFKLTDDVSLLEDTLAELTQENKELESKFTKTYNPDLSASNGLKNPEPIVNSDPYSRFLQLESNIPSSDPDPSLDKDLENKEDAVNPRNSSDVSSLNLDEMPLEDIVSSLKKLDGMEPSEIGKNGGEVDEEEQDKNGEENLTLSPHCVENGEEYKDGGAWICCDGCNRYLMNLYVFRKRKKKLQSIFLRKCSNFN